MNRPPDVCRFVLVCGFEDWQIQAAPRARSDMGGARETFLAVCEAHRVHIFEDHTEAEREAMRSQLERMQTPGIAANREHAAGMLVGVPLPRWWVDK